MTVKLTLPDLGPLVAEVAQELKERIQERTPVRTGRAQAGWEVTVTGDSARIHNDVEYVGFLENGTSKMEPFYMVRTTLMELPEIIEEAAEKHLKF